jgi:hypothetical protein
MEVGDAEGDYVISSQAECTSWRLAQSNTYNGETQYIYDVAVINTDSYPKGCSFERYWYTWTSTYYTIPKWNIFDSPHVCETSGTNGNYECPKQCYEKAGCGESNADNYDTDVDYNIYDTCIIPLQGSVKTPSVSNPASTLWYYKFADWAELGGSSVEYMVVEKDANFDCSAPPINGVMDLSTLDTQGKTLYIGKDAFNGCSDLTSIIFPDDVDVIIGYLAFSNTGITSLTIPTNVRLNEQSFSSSSALTSLTFEDGYTHTIRGFTGTGLTSIIIPDSVTTIGRDAFRDCALTSVTLSKTAITFGVYVFYGNPSFNLYIPSLTGCDCKSFCNDLYLNTIPLVNTAGFPLSVTIYSGISCNDLRTNFNANNCCYDSRTLTAMGV